MQEFTSIFKKSPYSALFVIFSLFFLGAFPRYEASAQDDVFFEEPAEKDLGTEIFNDYGDTDEEAEEQAEDERFFRYGRFVSLGIGGGATMITGNRGSLYGTGTPTIRAHFVYFFDFNWALAVNYVTSQHAFYLDDPDVQGVEVKIDRWLFDLRYYIDTKNLSKFFTVTNPYFFVGAGPWKRTESKIQKNSITKQNAVGFGGGGGFDIKVGKGTYVNLEGRYDSVPFGDRSSTEYADRGGPSDLTGDFITLTASLVFSW